jgi:hypothetical protein
MQSLLALYCIAFVVACISHMVQSVVLCHILHKDLVYDNATSVARLVCVRVDSEIGSYIAGGLFQSSRGGGRIGGAIAQTCTGFGSIRIVSDRLYRYFISIIIIFRIHTSIIIFRTHASNFIEYTEHIVSLLNQEKTTVHNNKQTV